MINGIDISGGVNQKDYPFLLKSWMSQHLVPFFICPT